MRKLGLLLLFCFVGNYLVAQSAVSSERQDRKQQIEQKMKSLRIGFLTDQLSLTPSESQAFWPIDNAYHEKLKGLKESMKPKKGRVDVDEMSDSEIRSMINRHFELREQEISLMKKYYADLGNVLPMKKVGKLHLAEAKFKRRILSMARGQKGKAQRNKGSRKGQNTPN